MVAPAMISAIAARTRIALSSPLPASAQSLTLPKPEQQGKGIGSGLEEAIPTAISPSRIRELIQSSFPLTPVPGVPEIRLHKAGPGSGLWRFAEADKDFDAPYWAYHWG